MADYNINAVTRRAVFTGSAGLGPYAFTFEIIDSGDLAVYFNATKLTITTDYTVSINANGTGDVTIVTGGSVPSTPTASDQIVIVGARDIERVTDFVTAGDLLASSLNEQLDALTIFDQQVSEEGRRAMRAPVYDPALVEDGGVVDMTLPSKTSRAGKTLAFDSDGNPTVGEDIGNWRGDWAASVAYGVRDIVRDASNYNIYRCNTAHTSSGTTPISSNADSAKWDLVIDASYAATQATNAAASATAAATSATNAATSATNAATSETNAATSETNAATSETNAATSATNAATSATNAANSASAAEATFDLFDDAYLGAKASDPTLDNDGNALQDGALYFDTTNNVMKVYDLGTTTWFQLTPTVANQTNINTVAANITNVNTTATNITGVNSFAERYRVASSDPATSLDEGDLVYNSTDNALKYYNGTSWVSIAAGLSDVVSDTTPQLGGDLDVNGNSIVSASNGDINLTPNGTGNVLLGNYEFDVDQTVGAGQDDYVLTYDNATGHISLEAAGAGGAGYFQGENGATGDTTNGKGDIFRVHEQELNTNTTIAAGDNAGAFFSLTVATGVTLTVNGNLVIA